MPGVSLASCVSLANMLSTGPPGSLDSSLKKHTTLINKLKSSLLIGPADALIKDIDGLTLTKYLDEIVAAVVEGAAKKGDPEVAVDVSSPSAAFTQHTPI